MPGGFQFTVFVGGHVCRVTDQCAAMELLLDMDRRRRGAVHTLHGARQFDALELLPDRCRWWRCCPERGPAQGQGRRAHVGEGPSGQGAGSHGHCSL